MSLLDWYNGKLRYLAALVIAMPRYSSEISNPPAFPSRSHTVCTSLERSLLSLLCLTDLPVSFRLPSFAWYSLVNLFSFNPSENSLTLPLSKAMLNSFNKSKMSFPLWLASLTYLPTTGALAKTLRKPWNFAFKFLSAFKSRALLISTAAVRISSAISSAGRFL